MMASDDKLLGRRDLLRGALAGSLLAAAPPAAGALDLGRVPGYLPPDARVPGFCELCFWNCGLIAEVRNGRVARVEGHPGYPNARGKLCARGHAGPRAVEDPARLRYPMLRTGKRGEGRFERAGWPSALRAIARGLEQVKTAHGPESVALFHHGRGASFFRRLAAAFGTPNVAAPSDAQCKGPRNTGYELTFGEKLPSPEPLDLANARAILLLGSHLGENAHNSQMQDFVRGLRGGARAITVDPRFSTAASKSELWLPIEPGADIALLLAWIRLLLIRGTYHRDFVENQCTGLPELRAGVEHATLEWAAIHTGLTPEQIEAGYRILIESMPRVVVHPGRHVTWYGDDTQRARAMAVLTALLGAWWTEGGILRTSAPALQDYPGPDYPDTKPDVDKAAGRYPFAQEPSTTGIRDATRTGSPYPIKAWIVYGTNLPQSLPAPAETEEAIAKLDLLVVCDTMPTEITRYADVLLPEDTYLERYDDVVAGNSTAPYLGLRRPAARPRHDTRPAWRIARDLAREMGLGDYFAYEDIRDYLRERLAGTGVELERLEREGIVPMPPKVPATLDPKVPHEWKTPSGKVELASARLAAKGFSAVPQYTSHGKPTGGSLRLLYGRSPVHTFARTQHNSILASVEDENEAWVHPEDARAAGVTDGERVMLENHGARSGPVKTKVTERISRGCVYLTHGFGSLLSGGRGASDTALMREYKIDPICGATGMRVSFVKLGRG